jgi:hypothetical protein
LAMVIVYNLNDEIPPNTNWKFWLKSGGLDCFKIYIYKIECKKKDCTKIFKFNYTCTFHHLMEGSEFFFKFFLLQYLEEVRVWEVALHYVIWWFTIFAFLLCGILCLRF